MKLFVKFSFTAIALVLFFNAIAVIETNAQTAIPEIMKRMEKSRDNLSSLQANVKMVKTNTQLGEVEDNLSGTVMYLPETKDRGMYMRINWTKPVREELAVIEDEYTLYRPTLKQAILGKVDKAKNSASSGNALSFMTMSKSELKDNYSVKLIGEEKVGSGTATWHLVLTPKKAGKYKSAELWVDKDGMPVQAKIVENNMVTEVLLSGIKTNVAIKASVFKIDYPRDTKEIKG
jgi:outer membrane lipoprotein-sorting protein